MSGEIAIVGMACRYPDARTPEELWENVVAKRRAFRRIPDERLNRDDYVDPDPTVPDQTYVGQAAVIEGWSFDRVAYRVAGSTYRAADIAHWLALDVATEALDAAGFPHGEGLPNTTTGVHLGNTLTGEFSRASVMRLRWPYVRRVIDAQLAGEGWPAERRSVFLAEMEARYKQPFAPVGNETLAGGLSNTIAGRICNHFDLKGGGYTVDGACAASLLSVITACNALTVEDLDVAVAGGIDLSLDPFELIGFAKTGALAAEEMRVYDERSAGFWPGEGCGILVLMRREDAVAQGRPIHAVLRGWGMSSDGSGGITRPDIEGQLLAIHRAYRRAGFGIETVACHEGHGTGTQVGDATELEVLTKARRDADATAAPAVISSIKANIGHTKAAAGVAGLIKAVCAVRTRTLPPATACDRPHPTLTTNTPALRVLDRGAPWPEDAPVRASVSAMGFGGINTHVVIEAPESHTPERNAIIAAPRPEILRAAQDVELFTLHAPDRASMTERIDALLGYSHRISRAELGDLAAALASSVRDAAGDGVRVAIVARTPEELTERLTTARAGLTRGPANTIDVAGGVFLGAGTQRPRIGLVFPGQGSPAPRTGGAIARRFDKVDELYDRLDLPESLDAVSTIIQQPAIVTASMAALRVLQRVGLEAEIAAGHSLGELTALHWAGAFDEAQLLRIATARAAAMSQLGSPTGAMASIVAPESEVRSLIEEAPSLGIAGLNGPEQIVVSGPAADVDALVDRARRIGRRAVRLPVSHAFHSPLVAAAVPRLAEHLRSETCHRLERPVASTITGRLLDPDIDVTQLLSEQVTAPVRFTEAAAALRERADLLIEVGPGRVLAGLLAANDCPPVVPVDAGGDSLEGLLGAIGAAYAMGAPVDARRLFEDRFTRPFDLEWTPVFLSSPCEQVATLDDGAAPVIPMSTEHNGSAMALNGTGDTTDGGGADSARDVLVRLVADHAELPRDSVRDEDRFLSDLHLNSLTVGQLISDAARLIGATPPASPTDFADASIGEVVEVLAQRALASSTGVTETPEPRMPAGIDAWVGAFEVRLVDQARPGARVPSGEGTWQVLVGEGSEIDGAALQEALAERAGGAGVAVCIPSAPDARHIDVLLTGARAQLALGAGTRFVIVQHGGGAAAIARTLHLEAPAIDTCVVDVPVGASASVEWIADEAAAVSGYAEAHYDAHGTRREPRLAAWSVDATGAPDDERNESIPLTTEDTLLVTGGGKGITAESALVLAQRTGVRLALMGRSKPADDAELAAHLARLEAHGVSFRYVAADVCDAEAVRRATVEIERELGPITGVLHGAGINVPQLLTALDADEVQRTLAPKINGFDNVLSAIDPDRLRVLIAFGSIIGRMGFQGEGDYALANEWLTLRVEDFQATHPACRCLALEWSIWSGLGMGQRLGRVDALSERGITPISPEAGTNMLLRLLGDASAPTTLVVTGRFGAPATVRLAYHEHPLARFLQRPRVDYPDVELVVDADITPRTDPYVLDHIYDGQRLFPAVFGLEAMTEVVRALDAGEAPAPWFEQVEFVRPVIVPEEGVTIRVASLRRSASTIDVALRCEGTGFQADHFRARCRLDAPPEPAGPTWDPIPADAVSGLQPGRDLYGPILFQSGRFERLGEYRTLRAVECTALIDERSGDAAPDLFDARLPATTLLGDPAARDAALHALQACIPHRTILPVSVERIVPIAEPAAGPRFVSARERRRDGDEFTYDMIVRDRDGHVCERWDGLCLRAVDQRPMPESVPAALLGPYFERRVPELMTPGSVHVSVLHDPSANRRTRGDRAVQEAVGSAECVRHRRADGRPEVAGQCAISAAHSGDVTIAVAGTGPVGCDVEPIVARPGSTWRDLLGAERMALAELIARDRGESLDTAATRVWAATEALKKAGAMRDAPLMLAPNVGGRDVVLESGSMAAATFIHRLRGVDVDGVEAEHVFAVLAQGQAG